MSLIVLNHIFEKSLRQNKIHW